MIEGAIGQRAVAPEERHERGNVKQLLDAYRQRCVSACLMYPTFLSSTVVLTLGAVYRSSAGSAALRAHRALPKTLDTTPPQDKKPLFIHLCQCDAVRESILSHLSKEDLASMRTVTRELSDHIAPLLFRNIAVTFRSGSFTRPARMAALERIGKHVRTLSFHMPHNAETFLPPLLDPVTGEEQAFSYEPQIDHRESWESSLRGPKYGSWEMTDLLIKQYGPLFHAATNIPSFVRTLTAVPSLRHLKISCPGQEPSQRYRRSAVDYALMSLRIALERTALPKLSALSLAPIHPGGLLYLRPNLGFGSSPRGSRRWAQIRKLVMDVDSWDFQRSRTDHLQLLHEYLLNFSSSVTRLSFRWNGSKGPCPFTLDTDGLVLSSSRSASSSLKPTSKGRKRPLLRRMSFSKLHYADLENARVDASQIYNFIHRHRRSLRECNFEKVDLQSGDWDDALAVLTRISGNERWKEGQQTQSPKRPQKARAPTPAPAPVPTVVDLEKPLPPIPFSSPVPVPRPLFAEKTKEELAIFLADGARQTLDDRQALDCMFFLRTSMPIVCS